MVDTTQAFAPAPPTRMREERLPVFGTLGRTFRIFGQAPLLFLGFSLFAAAPGLIRLAIVGAKAQQMTASGWIMLPVSMVLNYLIQIAMIFVAARLYEGARPTVGEALRVAQARFLSFVGVSLLVVLAAMVGSIALIVPGLILLCMFAVATPVCVLERLGPIDSLTRSRLLTKGSRWRILGIYALFFTPIIAFGLVNTFLLIKSGHVVPGLTLNALVSIVWAPIATIFVAIIYWELPGSRVGSGVATVFD